MFVSLCIGGEGIKSRLIMMMMIMKKLVNFKMLVIHGDHEGISDSLRSIQNSLFKITYFLG